jgi:hypothetical protein
VTCAGCHQNFSEDEFRIPYQGDAYHADCWRRKEMSVSRNYPHHGQRSDGWYPGPRDIAEGVSEYDFEGNDDQGAA